MQIGRYLLRHLLQLDGRCNRYRTDLATSRQISAAPRGSSL
jgi:hypothetical protein